MTVLELQNIVKCNPLVWNWQHCLQSRHENILHCAGTRPEGRQAYVLCLYRSCMHRVMSAGNREAYRSILRQETDKRAEKTRLKQVADCRLTEYPKINQLRLH